MRNLVALIVFGLLLSFGFSTYAQTPDGETPAVESICDGLGCATQELCNAYCEAMDCDGAPEASAKACDRVLQNYLDQAGELPPCIAPAGCVVDSDCPDGVSCNDGSCLECGDDLPECLAGEFCLAGVCVSF